MDVTALQELDCSLVFKVEGIKMHILLAASDFLPEIFIKTEVIIKGKRLRHLI